MPAAPEKDRAKRDTKRELTTALRGEREAMHLGMPLHLGSPGIAGIEPLERYERRALSRRNRAVQRFLEMMENKACRRDPHGKSGRHARSRRAVAIYG